MYLGPVHARGGGVYGVPLNGKDIDVFPAVAVGKEEVAIDVPTLLGLAKEKPLELDDQDPERPTLFEPAEREEEEPGFASEGVDADGDEEMIQDDEGLGDYSPSLPPSGDEAQEVIDNEGDMEVDMSIDWLTSHLLERVFEGPELRASSSDVSQSFTLKFGGSRICCKVPQHALSETSGEVLSPDLLYLSMKLELEELEAFGVGEVIPEYEARKEARSSGRRVLTSRWVNSVKKPGLYRSRLVVRDYASMGGTTLAEGIYSPTTSLEGLRVLSSLLCKRGSVLSCDVSVAFMHAAVSRPEYVELPSNVSIAASKGPLEAGATVYLRLKKAMVERVLCHTLVSEHTAEAASPPPHDVAAMLKFAWDPPSVNPERPKEAPPVAEIPSEGWSRPVTAQHPSHTTGNQSSASDCQNPGGRGKAR